MLEWQNWGSTLLYPFQVSDEGVKITILGNTIFFPFIYPLTKKKDTSSSKWFNK